MRMSAPTLASDTCRHQPERNIVTAITSVRVSPPFEILAEESTVGGPRP